jgi:hypothetical protein
VRIRHLTYSGQADRGRRLQVYQRHGVIIVAGQPPPVVVGPPPTWRRALADRRCSRLRAGTVNASINMQAPLFLTSFDGVLASRQAADRVERLATLMADAWSIRVDNCPDCTVEGDLNRPVAIAVLAHVRHAGAFEGIRDRVAVFGRGVDIVVEVAPGGRASPGSSHPPPMELMLGSVSLTVRVGQGAPLQPLTPGH